MTRLTREHYAKLYGPTTGDRIRLADTDLIIEITEDRCGGPGLAGEEAVFGGGKVLRESMGQSRLTRAGGARIPLSPVRSSSTTGESLRPTSVSATVVSSVSARRETRTSWTGWTPP